MHKIREGRHVYRDGANYITASSTPTIRHRAKDGMVHEITVLEESNGVSAPDADIEMSLSSDGGIEVDQDLAPGRYTVAVHFEDQGPHENFVGHDVQLVRLNDGQDLDELGMWIDWTQPIRAS